MNRLLVILVAFAFHLPCEAQKIHIKGKVLDGAQSGLYGAHIIPLSDWSRGVTTDIDGVFNLTLDKPDSVLISFISYEEETVFIETSDDELIVMLTRDTHLTETIEVVADRIISDDFIVKRISRLEVYKNPNAKGDALLAVNGTPAVTTLDESANISFRGSSPEQTGVFYNHVPIYDGVRFAQLNGIGTFSIFNTEMLKSIHVFPGNPPLEYGNVASGLVAIQSQEDAPDHAQTQINLSLANVGVFHKNAIGKKKETGLTIFSNYQPSELLKATNEEALREILWFRSVDVGLQLTHSINENSRVRVFNYLLNEGYDFDFISPSFNGVFEQRKLRNFTIGNYLLQTGKGVLSVNGGYSFSKQNLNFSLSEYNIDNKDSYLSVNYHQSSKRTEWKVGGAYDNRNQKFDGRVAQYSYALDRDHPHFSISENRNRQLIDLYGFFKYRPSKIISFGYAARMNAPINNQSMRLARQSNISYKPSERHQFIWSSGTYHQYQLGEAANLWVRSKQYSLDYKVAMGPMTGTISGYLKTANTDSVKTNIAGIETYWKYQVSKNFFIDASYSFIDMQESSNGESLPGVYDLNYFVRSGFEWKVSTYWTLAGRSLFRQGAYFDRVGSANYLPELDVFEPVFERRSNQERIAPYQIIDLNLSRLFSINEDITGVFFMSISNVLNRENTRSFSYNLDYSETTPQLFSRRTVFFGVVLYFL